MHQLMRKLPVARFYYKGNHSHPVKRTVLLVKSTKTKVTGYELREGKTRRDFRNAPIKSYLRDKIAKKTRNNEHAQFIRYDIMDLIENGI